MTRSRSRSPRRDDRREEHYSSRRDERREDSNSNRRRDEDRRSRSPERRSSDHKGKERESSRRSSRSRSRSPRDRHHHRSSTSRRRSRSTSSSSSSSDSDSRHHRKKKSSSSKYKLDSKGRDKEERRKRRQEKKDKKERKARKKSGHKVVEWGKYGVLVDSDIYTKNEEFRSWLLEEKRINADTLSKPKLKDVFREFMESYNTGTMPHDKYYNLESWEKKMTALRMGETVSNDDTYDFNKDMAAIKTSHRRVVVETSTYLDKSKLESLRKLQNERVEMEKMKQMGLQIKDSMGIRTETRDEAGMR